MTHLTLELHNPQITLPEEFHPIIFILKHNGKVLQGSYHAGIFYHQGIFYRTIEVAYWAVIPTKLDLQEEGEG